MSSLPSSLERAQRAACIAAESRATDVCILDLRKQTSLFDFFVIATGTSRRQLHAISEEIDRTFKREMNDKRLSIAGYQESRWIALDYGDVVVHLFDDETRNFYSLDELWGKAERLTFSATFSAEN